MLKGVFFNKKQSIACDAMQCLSAYISQQLKKIYSNTAPTLSKYCYCYDTLGVKVNRKKQLQIINQ